MPKEGQFKLSSMTMEQLDNLIHEAVRERAEIASDMSDPKMLIQSVFDSGFNINGEPIPPKDVGFGMVAITGVVKDKGNSGRHVCTLYTVRMNEHEQEEYWSWSDDSPSYIDSDSVKIDSLRRSVSIHSLPDNALIIQHKMEWNGNGHDRKSVEGFKVHNEYNDDGECIKVTFERVSKSLIRRLPSPPDQDG